MQKSIFKKYLGISMAIVFLSIFMLGSMMMVFFGQYWRKEKKELLTQNASSVAELAGPFLAGNREGDSEIRTAFVSSFMESFSTSIDADIFITDLDGRVIMGYFANSGMKDPAGVPEDAVTQAVDGLYEGRGDLGGMYRGRYYIIGVPVTLGKEGPGVGACFAATSVETVNAFQRELFRIFLWAAVAAIVVGFVAVGAYAVRLVKPLRQMSAAARSFGAGDFSVRVPVASSDELGQLAASFNNMANSLSNSEGMRRSFIANVSHELKTPMTTIAGFIDGILDGTIPREEQDTYLGIVSSEVKRLSRLVKSMLDLSRIDNGEMKLSPTRFDMTNTIVTTLLTFEKSIDEKGIEVRGLDDIRPVSVLGDQDLLHQVVYNLIENAVKFTNPGGYISVQITDSIDRTTVAIENSGQGIPSEELPMIFERFYKTDKSRSQDKNGMGLGLYIVRMILKLHHGDIVARSVEGQFCRFEFYIPKPQEAPRLKEPKVREPKQKEHRTKEKEIKGKETKRPEESEPDRRKEKENHD